MGGGWIKRRGYNTLTACTGWDPWLRMGNCPTRPGMGKHDYYISLGLEPPTLRDPGWIPKANPIHIFFKATAFSLPSLNCLPKSHWQCQCNLDVFWVYQRLTQSASYLGLRQGGFHHRPPIDDEAVGAQVRTEILDGAVLCSPPRGRWAIRRGGVENAFSYMHFPVFCCALGG